MSKKAFWIGAFLVIVAMSFVAGTYYGTGKSENTSAATPGEREILYWVAPMDANYRRDEPGKSPMGMDLVPVYADEVDGQPGVVRIDPTIVNNLGVRISTAQRGALARQIDTVGYVGYDEDTLQHIHIRVDGWIEKLATKAAGDPISEGQLLFELYSPTLVNAQQEYLASIRSGNSVLQGASEERLVALGVTSGEIQQLRKERKVRQRVRVYAPTDGVIAMLGVREGEFVTSATDILSVAELDRIWVLAEVFERQAAWVSPGQHAMVELDYLPGQVWHGTVDYVYPELDPKTRTLKVRLRFDNADEVLRPNMFTRVSIRGDRTDDVVHVPREALIRGGTVDRVVIALGEGRFRSQPVRVGVESGDRVAILSGISAGDPIVVSGQFLIDSESNIEAALSNMEQRIEAPVDHGQHQQNTPTDHSEHQQAAPMDHSEHQTESSQ
jgi:Cu(I)/Ag(I) efflux system membrane fusion protein